MGSSPIEQTNTVSKTPKPLHGNVWRLFYCFKRMPAKHTQKAPMTKLEEKRSSGFTITHQFKTKLEAVKYVSRETNIDEKDVHTCLILDGWFDHKYEHSGIDVQYRLNP